jgi:hypothetical protein
MLLKTQCLQLGSDLQGLTAFQRDRTERKQKKRRDHVLLVSGWDD